MKSQPYLFHWVELETNQPINDRPDCSTRRTFQRWWQVREAPCPPKGSVADAALSPDLWPQRAPTRMAQVLIEPTPRSRHRSNSHVIKVRMIEPSHASDR